MAFLSTEELEEMRRIDPRTVDKDTLVEIAGIDIDTTLPREERMESFIKQVKNPYCYLDHGVVVKIAFSGYKTMEEVLKDAVISEAESIPDAPEPKKGSQAKKKKPYALYPDVLG